MMYQFEADNVKEGQLAPAMVFFHGGNWETGTPAQFIPHCLHFKTRGMMTASFEYRTFGKHRTSPLEAMEDCQHAILELKKNAANFGIDPNRIYAAGAGAGAQLILHAAMSPDVMRDGELDARPAGLVLFSPVVETGPKSPAFENFPDKKAAKKASPINLVTKDLCPSIIFQGTLDRVVPFQQVVDFVKAMRKKKNRCEFLDYEGADHSFFNFNTSLKFYELTIMAADSFLVDLGVLEPDEPPII